MYVYSFICRYVYFILWILFFAFLKHMTRLYYTRFSMKDNFQRFLQKRSPHTLQICLLLRSPYSNYLNASSDRPTDTQPFFVRSNVRNTKSTLFFLQSFKLWKSSRFPPPSKEVTELEKRPSKQKFIVLGEDSCRSACNFCSVPGNILRIFQQTAELIHKNWPNSFIH